MLALVEQQLAKLQMVWASEATRGDMEIMLRITSPYFVAGIDLTTRKVAPIISYMKNWTVKGIVRYAKRKGWKVEMIFRGKWYKIV